jgi:hypothetical protein
MRCVKPDTAEAVVAPAFLLFATCNEIGRGVAMDPRNKCEGDSEQMVGARP